jgi:hypothetical protein
MIRFERTSSTPGEAHAGVQPEGWRVVGSHPDFEQFLGRFGGREGRELDCSGLLERDSRYLWPYTKGEAARLAVVRPLASKTDAVARFDDERHEVRSR